jgi:hypothetical protein
MQHESSTTVHSCICVIHLHERKQASVNDDTHSHMHMSMLTSGPAAGLEIHLVELLAAVSPAPVTVLEVVPVKYPRRLCERKRLLQTEQDQYGLVSG